MGDGKGGEEGGGQWNEGGFHRSIRWNVWVDIGNLYVYKTEMSVCLSVHHVWRGDFTDGMPGWRHVWRGRGGGGGGHGGEGGGEGGQERGGNGEGGFLHVWRGDGGGGWTGRRGAMERGDFIDAMPGRTYFSRAMLDHPANSYKTEMSVCPPCLEKGWGERERERGGGGGQGRWTGRKGGNGEGEFHMDTMECLGRHRLLGYRL